MRVLSGFIDRILFTIGVLVFLQVPHFVDQYTQRLGGYYTSERAHLDKYQAIANKNYNGDLNKLIQDFKSSTNAAIVQTGLEIEKTRYRIVEIKKGLDVLEGSEFLPKIFYLARNIDYVITSGTMSVFRPGVPFTIEAVICGIFGGVLFSLIYNGVIRIPGLIIRKIFYTPKHQYIS